MSTNNSRRVDVTADNDREPLARPAEVAAYLGDMSVDALAQLRFRRKGPVYVQIGRKVLYRWADVRAWEYAHRVETR